MWKKVDQYVKKHQMIETGDSILLGLSGGADSIALARYLLILREKKYIVLHAIHINHQLRGEEATRDANFVRDFCEKWKIPYRIFSEDVYSYAREHKLSLEEAGREIRYARMEEYASETGCNKIALAHHADDLAETMVFRMLRGTGPEGFSGILPLYSNRIRPLLCLEKKEILKKLSDLGQTYVEDSSNQESDYCRNYIRSQILPKMKEVNPQALAHMSHLSEQVQAQNTFVKKQLDQIYEKQIIREENGLGMAISFFKKEDEFTANEMIRRMLFEKCGKRRDISAVHVDIIRQLVEKECGKYNQLPYDMIAYRGEETLWIGMEKQFLEEKKVEEVLDHSDCFHPIPKEQLEKEGTCTVSIEGNGKIKFRICKDIPEEIPKNHCIKYFDYDKIKCTLSIRTRKEGDYLVLDRYGKKKMIRRYFIDEKIPASQRNQILLLADDSHILCVGGGRISETYKVTESTKRVLQVEYPKNTV